MLCCLAESSCDNNCQNSDGDGEESEHLIDDEEHESDTTVDMKCLDVTKTDLHNEDLHGITNDEGGLKVMVMEVTLVIMIEQKYRKGTENMLE